MQDFWPKVTEKTVKRFEIFIEVKAGNMTLKQAGRELGLSYRHTRQLYKRYRMKGLIGLGFHRKHPPWNKIPEERKKKVLALRTKYPAYNGLHFYDCFREEYPDDPISYSTTRRILIEGKMYSGKPVKRKRTRKRFEKEKPGELLQMDTSRHKWLPDIDQYFGLILIIDDHSRKFLDASLVEGDTTWNNMLALRRVVEKHGVFRALYTDNDSKFKFNKRSFSLHFDYHKDPDDVHTQIDMALSELRILLLHTPPHDAPSKGKVERPFRMFQDRLIKEFRANNIKTLGDANKWLRRRVEWWNNNHRHWVTKETPEKRFNKDSLFQPVPYGVNLDDVFCLRRKRIVRRDNTFSYGNEVFQITKATYSRSNWYKMEVELHIIPGRKIRVFHEDEFMQEFSLNGKKKLANINGKRYKEERRTFLLNNKEDILPEQ